jgi:hypothetical protein
MLTYKRLNEVIATDIYFSNEKSIEGYHCAQVFFGMTSKMLCIAGMKTESEFADVYLDYIRRYGIPSALWRDNAKSEMIQHVKDIHRDLIIADQWTEPHSTWKKPAELNGVKDLKSHGQVLLDRVGAPDNLWFLAKEYLSNVDNLSENLQLNWKIPEQISRGDTRHIVLLVWTCTLFRSSLKISVFKTTEKSGYFVGFAYNIGDALAFKILKNDLVTVLDRSVVWAGVDASHWIEEYHLSQMYKNHLNH